MIDELRETLDRQAEAVMPKPDPYGRLMRRRARRRTIVAAVVATLALSSAAPAAMLMRESYRPAGAPPAELQPMLGSGTRGSLAGDTGFLAAIRQRAADEVDRERVGGPHDLYLPSDPDSIRVLFAGDLGGSRIAVVAGVTARPLRATYFGPQGEAPQRLWLAEWGELGSVAQPVWGTPGQQHQLIFGPEGSTLEVGAETRYTRDGPRTDWRAVDADVYLAFSTTTAPGTRIRVSGKGIPAVEVPVSAVREVDPDRVVVDEASLTGHGDGVRRAAQEAAFAVARRTGLSADRAKFMLLWGGQIEMGNLTGPTASAATVLALTPDGGGPFATVALDAGDLTREPITLPAGDGAIGDPATSVIVHRLPESAPGPGDRPEAVPESDRLLIIGPPSATFAKIIEGGVWRTRVALERGAGETTWAGRTTILVRACRDDGSVVAEAAYDDVS